MNKKDAAKFLGVSASTLLRYASGGHIRVTYPRQRVGAAVADFDMEDLYKLKKELSSGAAVRPDVQKNEESQAMTRHDDLPSPVDIIKALEAFMAQAAAQALLPGKERTAGSRPALSPSEKLLLTLDDCAVLSSLSKDYLRQAIKDKKLKARILGRGWKVKREDLEAFIKKL
jgi:excisionase family DNA binding protein